MADIIFYTNPQSRGRIVRWMLEEVGQPYETEVIPYDQMKSDRYLAVNPMGKVPAIKHRDHIVTEMRRICAYLADVFPTGRSLARAMTRSDTTAGCLRCRAGRAGRRQSPRSAGSRPPSTADVRLRQLRQGRLRARRALLASRLRLRRPLHCRGRLRRFRDYVGNTVRHAPQRDSFSRYSERLKSREQFRRASEEEMSRSTRSPLTLPSRRANASSCRPCARRA